MGLGQNLCCFGVGVAILLPSTTASVCGSGAVEALLLGKLDELLLGNIVRTLDGSYGRESPA